VFGGGKPESACGLFLVCQKQSHKMDKEQSMSQTRAHIARVAELLEAVVDEIKRRAECHDASKLQEPEATGFAGVSSALVGLTYGSPEYREALQEMRPTIRHHYAHNRHHPEHFRNGVAGMNIVDVVEMLCDWKAAGERHGDGCIEKSIEINRKRFQVPDVLTAIFLNTAVDFGWSNLNRGEVLGHLDIPPQPPYYGAKSA